MHLCTSVCALHNEFIGTKQHKQRKTMHSGHTTLHNVMANVKSSKKEESERERKEVAPLTMSFVQKLSKFFGHFQLAQQVGQLVWLS